MGDSIGERVRRAYQDAGYNRHSFARELGVAYSTISDWEKKGRTPGSDTLARIAELTGVGVDQILGTELPGPPPGQHQDVLEAFLVEARQHGEEISDNMLATLRSIDFHGLRPRPLTFHMILAALQTCEPA